jgi:hypothetical protein
MLRTDHYFMMSQKTGDGADHWTTIRLIDKSEAKDGSLITGVWKHTDKSYSDREIKFTSDNPQYLYFEWKGGPQGGDLQIGSKMGRASHKAGEDETFQVLITLLDVKRIPAGKFKLGSADGEGTGTLAYNVEPHFKKGDITWMVVRYEH